MKAHHKAILLAAGAVWLAGLGFGVRALWQFEVTPGASTDPPSRWPVSSQLVRRPDRFTLVVAAHPHCPCTRASIQGLATVMSRRQGRVTAHVLVLKPTEFPDEWTKTDIWRSAERIPGVTVLADVDGREADRFQARTSGQAILYDPRGRLVFNGGLTAARGRAGPSAGQEQIVSLVDGTAAGPVVARVFGCALGSEPAGQGQR